MMANSFTHISQQRRYFCLEKKLCYYSLMKYTKTLIILLSFIPFLSEAIALSPSLEVQMYLNEQIQKEVTLQNKKILNHARLESLRTNNQQKKLRWNLLQKTTSISQSSPLTSSKTWASDTIRLSATGNLLSFSSVTSNATLTGVDLPRVYDAWFSWYNSYRSSLGLWIYSHDPRLDKTAHDWNMQFANSQGKNHHTRNPGDGYYNFSVIDQWFKNRGVNPKIIHRSKFTENVWYGSYHCTKNDCTDALIASIRTTFDFYMSEKGKSYDAHYRSIVNPDFTKMGLDILIVPTEKRYYITIHYITE